MFPKPERHRRPRPARTPAAEAEYVLWRDRECVLAKLVRWGTISGHECEGRLTIEHLTRRAGRRVHGRKHMVACCLHGNVDGDASKWRDELRAYVLRVEGP